MVSRYFLKTFCVSPFFWKTIQCSVLFLGFFLHSSAAPWETHQVGVFSLLLVTRLLVSGLVSWFLLTS